jgi:hypothetical protein
LAEQYLFATRLLDPIEEEVVLVRLLEQFMQTIYPVPLQNLALVL